MAKKIIAICGLIGAGKDTVADYLVNQYQYERFSFAEPLKDAVSAIFSWDRDMLEGRSEHSREIRERDDQWWSSRLGFRVSPRRILQTWGTEILRQNFHNDLWVAALERRLIDTFNNVVITDCRFPNEVASIQKMGGKMIRVVRGQDPDWFKAAVDYMTKDRFSYEYDVAERKLLDAGVHPSEYSWAGVKFDSIIYNFAGYNELYMQIDKLIKE